MNINLIGYKKDILDIKQCFSDRLDIELTITEIDSSLGISGFDKDFLISFDYIVIGIRNQKLRKHIYDILLTLFDKSANILDFYSLYENISPSMRVDCLMSALLPDKYDGLIFGISHAEVGILPEYMPGYCCNLAISSQDIFYNVKTLEHCLENYYEKISQIKYVVLDLFDYTYFNYDLSKSKSIIQYLADGGYRLDSHNYSENKNFNFSFEEALSYIKREKSTPIVQDQANAFENIFDKVQNITASSYYETSFQEILSFRMSHITDISSKYNLTTTSIVRNIYESTINENIQLFEIMLDALYSINPDLKVYAVLIPRYSEYQQTIDFAYEGWKKYFYEILSVFQEKYPITLWDLKKDEISEHPEYYYDTSHLNYYGAMVFTKKISKLIAKDLGF